MDVTICVGTFGSAEWVALAHERAIPSAEAQGVPVIHRHAATLAEARNAALHFVKTEWVVFLDADDELDEGYLNALSQGTADVRGPIAHYLRGSRERAWQPRVFGHTHDCTAECITSGEGNWLLIVASVRTALAREAGGWKVLPVYEDFDFWMRVLLLGASAELIPDAIYRAHARADSRNRGTPVEERNRTHHAIVAANLGHAMAA
jgi:glycosyltransferase involved in cell wall biosynthesis